MKRYLTLAIPLGLIVLGIIAAVLTAGAMESPRSRLAKMIEPDIEAAQRMLQDYDPVSLQLVRLLGEGAETPGEIDFDQWREFLTAGEEEAGVREALQTQEHRLRELLDRRARIEGTTLAPPAVPNPAEAYPQLLRKLEENGRRLQDALQRVRSALATSAGSGENEIRGDSSPAATQLEARLLYHQADLLLRRAALHRHEAQRHRNRLERLADPFRALMTESRSLEAEIAGSQAGAISLAPAATRPDAARAADATAPEQAVPSAGRGAIARFFSRMFEAAPGHAAAPPPQAARQPETAPAAPQPASPPAEATVRVEAVPPLARLIEERQAMRRRVESELQEAQAAVKELENKVRDLEDRISRARQTASQAEQRMLAMEKEPPDASDPAATEAFVAEYERLAAEQRRAELEALLLEQGAVRNARPNTDDEEKLATAPLVPVRPDVPMEPERGLTAVKADLQVARGLVETRQALLQELDRQIAELQARTEAVRERTARILAARREMAALAAEDAAAAMAESAQADQLEQECIALAAEQGLRAAQRARRAADAAIREAGELNSANPPDKPNPRLDLMAKARFTAGHAQAIEGDMQYLIASAYAQKALDLERTARMNAFLAEMGVSPPPVRPSESATEVSPAQEAAAAWPAEPDASGVNPPPSAAVGEEAPSPPPPGPESPEQANDNSAAALESSEPAESTEDASESQVEKPQSDAAAEETPATEPLEADNPPPAAPEPAPTGSEPQESPAQEQTSPPPADEPPGVEAVYQEPDPAKAAAIARRLASLHANSALEAYQQAADSLGNLWVLHANLAAVKFLLASLAPETERSQLLEQARREYDRALRNREDRPEFAAYDQARRQLILATGGQLPPPPPAGGQTQAPAAEADQPQNESQGEGEGEGEGEETDQEAAPADEPSGS